MKEIGRRLARLEAAHPIGGARHPTPARQAHAIAELTRIIEFYTAEKVAGDPDGIAARDLPELIAMCERSLAERRT